MEQRVHGLKMNAAGFRAIMQCQNAQDMVNSAAESICESANSAGGDYVVHPRILRVSAHAFVDPNGRQKAGTLERAFWSKQGGA